MLNPNKKEDELKKMIWIIGFILCAIMISLPLSGPMANAQETEEAAAQPGLSSQGPQDPAELGAFLDGGHAACRAGEARPVPLDPNNRAFNSN